MNLFWWNDVLGRGHQTVISVVSKQFGIFSDLLGGLFDGEDESYRKTDKKADPDEALKVFRNQKFVARVIL